jgi:hypothetical protein
MLGISFQAHINAAETKRLAELGQKYRNPYNFGPAHNWHLFLGNLPQISVNRAPWRLPTFAVYSARIYRPSYGLVFAKTRSINTGTVFLGRSRYCCIATPLSV